MARFQELALMFLCIWVLSFSSISIFIGWKILRWIPNEEFTPRSLYRAGRETLTSKKGVDTWRAFLEFGALQLGRFHLYDKEGKIWRVGLDVSGDLEFTFLQDYFERNPAKAPTEHFILDVGAHDCITASNSHNFLQLGWSGLLIEPYPPNYQRCVNSLGPWNGYGSRFAVVNVAAGLEDGQLTLYRYDHAATQVSQAHSQVRTAMEEFKVQQRDLAKLCDERQVPKELGILSLDIEIDPEPLVHHLLSNSYRPKFMIIEGDALHYEGYMLIWRRNLNKIFERID